MSKNTGNNRTRVGQVSAYTAITPAPCALCNKPHLLSQCGEFKKLLPAARLSQAQQLRACFNCLNLGHRSRECTRSSCKICGKRHHTLLHLDQVERRQADSAIARGSVASGTVAIREGDEALVVKPANVAITYFTQRQGCKETVILSTALVYAVDRHGFQHECRALLDSGSQSHFITKAMTEKLDLPCSRSDTRVTGIGGYTHGVQHETCVEVSSRYNGFRRTIPCLVLTKIAGNMPNESLLLRDLPIPSGIELAHPHFDESEEIDIIIGAGLVWDLQCVGRHSLGLNHPILQYSINQYSIN